MAGDAVDGLLDGLAQGRVREGLETIRSLEVTGTTPENVLHRAHLVAVAHLWLGEPREAWDTLAAALEGVLDHPAVARSCQPFTVLARAAIVGVASAVIAPHSRPN